MSDEKETLNTRKKRVPLKKRLKKIGMKVVMLGAVFLGYKYTKNQDTDVGRLVPGTAMQIPLDKPEKIASVYEKGAEKVREENGSEILAEQMDEAADAAEVLASLKKGNSEENEGLEPDKSSEQLSENPQTTSQMEIKEAEKTLEKEEGDVINTQGRIDMGQAGRNDRQESLGTPVGEKKVSLKTVEEQQYAAFYAVDCLLKMYKEQNRTSLNEDEVRSLKGYCATWLGRDSRATTMVNDAQKALERGMDPTKTDMYKKAVAISKGRFNKIQADRKAEIEEKVRESLKQRKAFSLDIKNKGQQPGLLAFREKGR